LIHGGAKAPTFVLLPSGGVAAFDWEVVSAAPATVELGWYLIVNATRLARPRGAGVALHRSRLEQSLGPRLGPGEWERMLDAGCFAASLMLMWSKALALNEGRAGAAAEWAWWVERIEAVASH